jgi:hypothetical protein
MSLPARSSKTNVNPPEAPMPGIAGGGKEKEIPSPIVASSLFKRALIASYYSSGFLRLLHSSKVTKKKPL